MKFSEFSNIFINFFFKNNCITSLNNTHKSSDILQSLFDKIIDGFEIIRNFKTNIGCQLQIHKYIKNMPKPDTFSSNNFPSTVVNHIDKEILSCLEYKCNLFEKEITILFYLENEDAKKYVKIYNNYVDYMLVWLFVANQYASRKCAKTLKIFIYHTSLNKMIPNSSIEILNENHVNTAFTRTCPVNSEIIVFRKEEWFKVFIHETFHNLGLDFSDMNNNTCHSKIRQLFSVNSDVNLFESYTEFWARIMNSLFCSYVYTKDKNDMNELLTNAEFYINMERVFSNYQMIKILNYMQLDYQTLIEQSYAAEILKKTLYKENTSVLAYYIITNILLNNYPSFLSWCDENNTLLLQFKKTIINQRKFCEFIQKKHKTKSFLDNIFCIKNLFIKFNNKKYDNDKNIKILRNNLRMTLCELE